MRIIGIEEEDPQLKGSENIFNKITEGNFPNMKKDMPIKVQNSNSTPNRLDQKRKTTCHIIIKMLNTENKEGILKEL